MGKNRLEAFSDGVIAVIITIMVLEMKVPHGASPADLLPLLPVFLSYELSFVYVGIYWGNHHHLFHLVKHVDGRVLWANNHLLFWLSLIPFVTGWMGEMHFQSLPTACYGVVFLASAIAYTILQAKIIAQEGNESTLARAVGRDKKGKTSLLLYTCAIPLAFVHPLIADALYVVVAIIWLVPDRRIEDRLTTRSAAPSPHGHSGRG